MEYSNLITELLSAPHSELHCLVCCYILIKIVELQYIRKELHSALHSELLLCLLKYNYLKYKLKCLITKDLIETSSLDTY